MTAATVRCFFALEPPPPTRRALVDVVDALRARVPDRGVRWVRPEQLHVTVKFVGDVDSARVEALCAAASAARAWPPCGPVRAEGFGCFPSRGAPRVVWAGLTGDADGVRAVAAAAETLACDAAGVAPERRPFRPHVTLARVRSKPVDGGAALTAALDAVESATIEWGQPTEVVLLRSTLDPRGARYDRIAAWPLAGPSSPPTT